MSKTKGYLAGKMLIAAPGMGDPRFARTLLFICAHDAEHAIGLVVNQPMHALRFPALLRQLNLKPTAAPTPDYPVLSGGPVEPERGFVLHSLDYNKPDETLEICSQLGMSASTEILLAMASNSPPKQHLLALGISSWGSGQIEEEIKANAWLICETDNNLLFDHAFESKWQRAMNKIGVDPDRFSDIAGHA